MAPLSKVSVMTAREYNEAEIILRKFMYTIGVLGFGVDWDNKYYYRVYSYVHKHMEQYSSLKEA